MHGKISPNAFCKEICQIFIQELFFIFFTLWLFLTKCYISLGFYNILLCFDTSPCIFITENMEGKKRSNLGVTKLVIFMFFYEHNFFSHFCSDKIAWDNWSNKSKIIKIDCILWNLTKRGFQNWYDFLSFHLSSPQKMEVKKCEQISRTTFFDFFLIKY